MEINRAANRRELAKALGSRKNWILLPVVLLGALFVVYGFSGRMTPGQAGGFDELLPDAVSPPLEEPVEGTPVARSSLKPAEIALDPDELISIKPPEADSSWPATELFSAKALLDRFEKEHQWTIVERRANMAIWAEPCRRVFGDKPPLDSGSTFSDRNSLDLQLLLSMSEFCGDLPLQAELDMLNAFLEDDRSAHQERERRREEFDDALRAGDHKLIRQALFRMLRNALFRMDESALHGPLWELASRNLLDPPFSNAGSSDIYLQLIEPVSASLICWHQGGCMGARNPFVLRVCFTAFVRSGLYCQSPATIEEAIWQTLTPIHHEAWQRFFNQVIAGVTAE